MISKTISPNQFIKEMYEDQSGEFVCGYWGLKGLHQCQFDCSCLCFNFLIFFCFLSEANVADHKLGIGSDKNEASTSHKEQSPSKKSVEISITVPGTKKKKKGW